ncbi:MAG: hypothetical protein EPO00_04620 [Chloroflexota bacterium]|nr:MAG: hypothetical protein EPO00_04620 [Chloroflexota bacterium]
MPAATNKVTIGRSAEDVFAFLADGMNAQRWRSGVLDIALASGSGAGAVYHQGVAGPGGRRIAADYEVTAYEPPRRYAFRTIAGPVRPTGEFQLEPDGEGTAVTFQLSAELPFLKRLLMGGMVQKTMDAETQALTRAKAILEG